MSFVSELEPQSLWSHFDRILEIPRPSKGEEQICAHVVSLARARGLEVLTDATGNIVVQKPGKAGRENAPITILQAHLDMVQEKNSDVEHDFTKDPIRPRREGEYLYASGTTLGSDNGVGVAAMLAVMDTEDVEHGPLELLFTVDEETGLTGAAGLTDEMLSGRRLINVDSEEEGVLTIGCAGGADSLLTLPVERVAAPVNAATLGLRLSGMKGGHSGIDIQLQRGNAVRLLARALYAAWLEGPFSLVELNGGNAHNAIPREANARIAVPQGTADPRATLQQELEAIRSEYRPAEPGFEFTIEECGAADTVLDGRSTERVLALVNALPHGIEAMSYEIPELVETSTNLAVVTTGERDLSVQLSSRSSVASALSALRRRIRATAALVGASVREDNGYPGWTPDLDSGLLEVVRRIHGEVMHGEPEVGAVHAGLECGIIGEKWPEMDMISFGPQIEFPHSPDERVKIDTVARFYELLTTTLEHLSRP